ncbi:hypothetical protein KKA14_03525 [bacterium]|nr:hypothetical protein [bacterium]
MLSLEKTKLMKLAKKVVLFCGVCLFWLNTAYAAEAKIPKNKAGAIYYSQSGSEYTLVNKLTAGSGSDSDSLIGTVFFYERMFLDRFSMGFKYSSFLERNLSFEEGTNTLDVLETASFWSLDFKAFFRDNMRPGLKPFLGVSYGNYSLSSAITISPAAGSSSEETTTATIPVTILSTGFDYVFGFAGVRIEVGQSTGSRNDPDGSSTYRAAYQYGGLISSVSVYSFF